MASKDKSSLFYSNMEDIAIKNNEEIAPIVKIKKVDDNMDGIIDLFEFSLEFEGGYDVRKSELFLFFDYGLRVEVPPSSHLPPPSFLSPPSPLPPPF